MQVREHLPLAAELKDIVLADIVLTLAFSLTLIGGASALRSSYMTFIYLIPIVLVAVTLSFVLHEMMHKFTAQKYGAIAAFRSSVMGLGITLITGILGFLVGIPGATVIYTNTFTKNEEGVVSLAGPLTNFAIFIVFLLIKLAYFPHTTLTTVVVGVGTYMYVAALVNLTLFISILLAFFNMLPIYPLDGSKVFRWNKGVYAAVVVVLFVMLVLQLGLGTVLFTLAFLLVIALMLSFFFRGFRI